MSFSGTNFIERSNNIDRRAKTIFYYRLHAHEYKTCFARNPTPQNELGRPPRHPYLQTCFTSSPVSIRDTPGVTATVENNGYEYIDQSENNKAQPF